MPKTAKKPFKLVSPEVSAAVDKPAPSTPVPEKRPHGIVKHCQANGVDCADLVLTSSDDFEDSPRPVKRPVVTTPSKFSVSSAIMSVMRLHCPCVDCPRWHFTPRRVLGFSIAHEEYRAHRKAGILEPARDVTPHLLLNTVHSIRRPPAFPITHTGLDGVIAKIREELASFKSQIHDIGRHQRRLEVTILQMGALLDNLHERAKAEDDDA